MEDNTYQNEKTQKIIIIRFVKNTEINLNMEIDIEEKRKGIRETWVNVDLENLKKIQKVINQD